MTIESHHMQDNLTTPETQVLINRDGETATDGETAQPESVCDQAKPSEKESKPNTLASTLGSTVDALLQHPFTLLLVGTALSSYLIPNWTRQWQNQQTEMTTKIEMLSSIDKSSTQMILAVQYVYVGAKSQSQADYDNAYRQWQIDKQTIRSKIQAYYPESKLVGDWNQLSEKLDNFYMISGSSNPADRKNFANNFAVLQNELYQHKDALNQEILNTKMSIFSK